MKRGWEALSDNQTEGSVAHAADGAENASHFPANLSRDMASESGVVVPCGSALGDDEDEGGLLDSVPMSTMKEKRERQQQEERRKCPYLDTINRNMLDFDFEKVCSISLSNQNVYACLVCGRYFQGRGKNTHAYTHSVQARHHVFINLRTDRIYCLPDNYEVIDSSLDDIIRALRPRFNLGQTAVLDKRTTLAHDVFGVAYLPGFVGMNNLRKTDYVNVAVQALAHVPPLRAFFLRPELYETAAARSPLVAKFGELLRKIWSPWNFKCCISPHELLQEVSRASSKRFRIGTQADLIEFLSFFLNQLHLDLGGSRKSKSSIIYECFQGLVGVTTEQKRKKKEGGISSSSSSSAAGDEEGGHSGDGTQGAASGGLMSIEADQAINSVPLGDTEVTQCVSPFLFLSLDIPPCPLFKDSQGGNIIPQIPLFTVLEKYNGVRQTDVLHAGQRSRKTYQLQQLPPYLLLHLKRFTKNNFFVEKNPTIVNFPVKNLELKDYVSGVGGDMTLPSQGELENMTLPELRTLASAKGISLAGCVERSDVEARLHELLFAPLAELLATKYDLLANVCHDSPPGTDREASKQDPLASGSYRVHVLQNESDQWFEIEDLHVQETMPQLIGLSESYLMVYERKRADAKK